VSAFLFGFSSCFFFLFLIIECLGVFYLCFLCIFSFLWGLVLLVLHFLIYIYIYIFAVNKKRFPNKLIAICKVQEMGDWVEHLECLKFKLLISIIIF
jgi:hypothetical protein